MLKVQKPNSGYHQVSFTFLSYFHGARHQLSMMICYLMYEDDSFWFSRFIASPPGQFHKSFVSLSDLENQMSLTQSLNSQNRMMDNMGLSGTKVTLW